MWSSFQRTDRLEGTQQRQDEEGPRPSVHGERQTIQAALPSDERRLRSFRLSRQVRQPPEHIDRHQDNQGIHFRRLHSSRMGQHKQLQE